MALGNLLLVLFSGEKQFCQGGRPVPSGRWKVEVGGGRGDGVGTLKTQWQVGLTDQKCLVLLRDSEEGRENGS